MRSSDKVYADQATLIRIHHHQADLTIRCITIYLAVIEYLKVLHLRNILARKDPLGHITTYTYNADDRPVTVTDALNRITTIETDYKGRVTAVIDALSNRKEYGYDGNGSLVRITQGESTTTLAYDGSNRLKSVTDPEGNTATYEYASASGSCSSCSGSVDSPVKITDPLGNFTRYVYDKANRLSSAIDPMGNVSLLGRDAGGRMKSRTDANGNITTYEYDGLNRVRKQTDANNGVTSFTYDQYGVPSDRPPREIGRFGACIIEISAAYAVAPCAFLPCG